MLSRVLPTKFKKSGDPRTAAHPPPGGGVGVLPYKGLMGTCGQPGYFFRDFCLKQGIDFINFCLKLDCLQSAFSLKIRPDETKKESLCTDVPPLSEKKNVSHFFFSGLRPRFSRQAASPLACLPPPPPPPGAHRTYLPKR